MREEAADRIRRYAYFLDTPSVPPLSLDIVNDRQASVADRPSVPPTKLEPLIFRSAPYVYQSKGS